MLLTEDLPDSSAGDAALDAATHALRAVILASHEFRQSFAGYLNVGITDTIAMSHLAQGALTPGELATQIGLAPSSITTAVDRLERADLVERIPHTTDRRSMQIALTDNGHAALTLVARWTHAALLQVGPVHLPLFAQHLDKLAAAIREQSVKFDYAVASPAAPRR